MYKRQPSSHCFCEGFTINSPSTSPICVMAHGPSNGDVYKRQVPYLSTYLPSIHKIWSDTRFAIASSWSDMITVRFFCLLSLWSIDKNSSLYFISRYDAVSYTHLFVAKHRIHRIHSLVYKAKHRPTDCRVKHRCNHSVRWIFSYRLNCRPCDACHRCV